MRLTSPPRLACSGVASKVMHGCVGDAGVGRPGAYAAGAEVSPGASRAGTDERGEFTDASWHEAGARRNARDGRGGVSGWMVTSVQRTGCSVQRTGGSVYLRTGDCPLDTRPRTTRHSPRTLDSAKCTIVQSRVYDRTLGGAHRTVEGIVSVGEAVRSSDREPEKDHATER